MSEEQPAKPDFKPDWVKQDDAGNEIDTRPAYQKRTLKIAHPNCVVKAARIEANRTQPEVAKAVGITRESYNNYESGGTVPLHVARRIASYFGKTVTALWPFEPTDIVPPCTGELSSGKQ